MAPKKVKSTSNKAESPAHTKRKHSDTEAEPSGALASGSVDSHPEHHANGDKAEHVPSVEEPASVAVDAETKKPAAKKGKKAAALHDDNAAPKEKKPRVPRTPKEKKEPTKPTREQPTRAARSSTK